MAYTSIGTVLPAIVAALDAGLSVPVFDGKPISTPSDLSYLVVGGGLNAGDPAATMAQESISLGMKVRNEDLTIYCLAIGRASREPAARTLALAVIESTGAVLPQKPTPMSYNAVVATVEEIVPVFAQSGVTVHIPFSINVKARVVP